MLLSRCHRFSSECGVCVVVAVDAAAVDELLEEEHAGFEHDWY